MKLLADIQLYPDGGFTGPGTLGTAGAAGADNATRFSSLLSNIVGVLTIVAGIYFLFSSLIGAIGVISSGGDKAGLEGAKKRISTSVIGLIVVIVAIFLVDLLGNLLGFNSILDIETFINNFTI